MTQIILILCMCGSEAESERIAEALVNEHLAACVNIGAESKSIYRWENKVEATTERLLIIKTSADLFKRVEVRINELHSYDTPEIISVPVESGSEKYLSWLRAQVI